MKDPRSWGEDTFEKIHHRPQHGPHLRKKQRMFLPRCNGKNTYRKEEVAMATRDALLLRGQAAYLRVYRCPHCFYWHLTHKQKKRI